MAGLINRNMSVMYRVSLQTDEPISLSRTGRPTHKCCKCKLTVFTREHSQSSEGTNLKAASYSFSGRPLPPGQLAVSEDTSSGPDVSNIATKAVPVFKQWCPILRFCAISITELHPCIQVSFIIHPIVVLKVLMDIACHYNVAVAVPSLQP